jgi:pimeloyl-ACP methyl ester carboxylesterase
MKPAAGRRRLVVVCSRGIGNPQQPHLLTTDDKVIPRAPQREISERAGSSAVEIPAGHSVHVSQPGDVGPLIDEAAAAVSTRL